MAHAGDFYSTIIAQILRVNIADKTATRPSADSRRFACPNPAWGKYYRTGF
jgi:hypothetical protein